MRKSEDDPGTPISKEMDFFVKLFGMKIRCVRLEKGMKQEELARKSDLHYTYISSVEKGERNVSLKNIKKIVTALDMSLAEFFTDL